MSAAATMVLEAEATPLLEELDSLLRGFAALRTEARRAVVGTVTSLVADPETTEPERVAALALLALAHACPAE